MDRNRRQEGSMPHGQSAGTVGAHLKDVWQQVQEDGLTAAVLLAQGLEESVDVQTAELGPARVCVCGGRVIVPPSHHHPIIPPFHCTLFKRCGQRPHLPFS